MNAHCDTRRQPKGPTQQRWLRLPRDGQFVDPRFAGLGLATRARCLRDSELTPAGQRLAGAHGSEKGVCRHDYSYFRLAVGWSGWRSEVACWQLLREAEDVSVAVAPRLTWQAHFRSPTKLATATGNTRHPPHSTRHTPPTTVFHTPHSSHHTPPCATFHPPHPTRHGMQRTKLLT